MTPKMTTATDGVESLQITEARRTGITKLAARSMGVFSQ